MAEPSPPIALEYAAPPVFFRSEYSTRTPYTLLNALFAGTIGVAALAAVPLLLPQVDPTGRRLVQAFGVVLLIVAAGNAWHWCRNATCVVRLTADGVEIGRRFWPWTRVRAVGGVLESGGVTLTFDVRGAIEERANASLGALPAMRRDDFDALRLALDRHFATHGLDVKTAEPQFRETHL